MRRFKKKMMTVCMIAMICLGLVCFTGCSTVMDIFLAQQVFMIGTILYIEFGDDVDQWFRELVFPEWAYGAYEGEAK